MDDLTDIPANATQLDSFIKYCVGHFNKNVMPASHRLVDVIIIPADYGFEYAINITVMKRATVVFERTPKFADYSWVAMDTVIGIAVGKLETYERIMKKIEKKISIWLLKRT